MVGELSFASHPDFPSLVRSNMKNEEFGSEKVRKKKKFKFYFFFVCLLGEESF
jgi:hypothetical protein